MALLFLGFGALEFVVAASDAFWTALINIRAALLVLVLLYAERADAYFARRGSERRTADG